MEPRAFASEIDETALAGLRRGCRRTRERVYRAYADAAWNLALRLTACEDRAWDAVQDAFVGAFERIAQFRGPGGFGFWLRRILVNQVMDQYRRDRRLDRLDTDQAGHEPAPDPRWLDLESALASLEPADRLVVWLHDVEGMTHAEIADHTRRSVPWSKTRLSRARARLRQALDTQSIARERQA